MVSVGFAGQVVGLVLGGIYLGSWVDRVYAMAPWGVLAGMMLAFFACGVQLRVIMKLQAKEEERSEDDA